MSPIRKTFLLLGVFAVLCFGLAWWSAKSGNPIGAGVAVVFFFLLWRGMRRTGVVKAKRPTRRRGL